MPVTSGFAILLLERIYQQNNAVIYSFNLIHDYVIFYNVNKYLKFYRLC